MGKPPYFLREAVRAAENFTDLAKIWGTSNQVAPAAAAVVSVVCRKERRFKFIIKKWIGKRMNPPHPTGKANCGVVTAALRGNPAGG